MAILNSWECKRCGHNWFPRNIEIPKVCPKCKSALWNKVGGLTAKNKIPKATHHGELVIDNIKISCVVLEDGRRLISIRNIASALGRKGGGAYWQRKKSDSSGALLPEYIALPNLEPFISLETRKKLLETIVYTDVFGRKRSAQSPDLLALICDIWLKARDNGALATQAQEKSAKKAEEIIRSLAKVGIIVLIDEATGFINEKHQFEYRELFKEFIREEAGQYEKQFPDPLYDVFYKIYNLSKPLKKNHRPLFFARVTRKYVYKPLAGSDGALLDILNDKTPIITTNSGSKRRKHKLYQFLEKVGIDSLQAHIWQLIGIGRAAKNKREFDTLFGLVFPKDDGPLFRIDKDQK